MPNRGAGTAGETGAAAGAREAGTGMAREWREAAAAARPGDLRRLPPSPLPPLPPSITTVTCGSLAGRAAARTPYGASS
jgi:hypothetical protein